MSFCDTVKAYIDKTMVKNFFLSIQFFDFHLLFLRVIVQLGGAFFGNFCEFFKYLSNGP